MEIELKFLVSKSESERLSSALADSHFEIEQKPKLTLTNAYYDTPENTLRQWDFGLRTRYTKTATGAVSSEQTIKLASDGIGGLQKRPEYNHPLTGSQAEYTFADLTLFPENIWPQGFEVKETQGQLVKIFETNFERQVWLVTTASGAIVECVLDTGHVQATHEGEIKQQEILEFELELLQGEVSDIIEIARYLTTKLNAKLGHLSKAARGYMLAQGKQLKSKNLESYTVDINSQIEPAFIQLLSYGIHFIQHHEVVFTQSHSLKSLRRVLDGISLIIHILQLFSSFLPNSQCQRYIDRFKQWRAEHSWIEAFYQLDQLTGRKSPYRKDIDKSDYLRSTLESVKMPSGKLEKSVSHFSSRQYNHLFLGFIQWTNQKQWRNEIPLNALAKLAMPLTDVAQTWLDGHWLSLKDALTRLSSNANSLDIEATFWPLTQVLLTGICVDSLFEGEEQSHFRGHLLNLMVGFEEAILLKKSEQILSTCANCTTEEQDAIKWLQSKQQSLQMALSASVATTVKLKPYW